MRKKSHNWLLVKHDSGEVAGIVELKYTHDHDHDEYRSWVLERVQLMNEYIGSQNWGWDLISQAEFGTYRDLHGFEVIEL